MTFKNYRAYTMAEALAAVKRDLGPDAIVVHTRTFTQGGFLGFGRKSVVEVSAAAASDLAPPRRNGKAGDGHPAPAAMRSPAAAVATRAYGAAASRPADTGADAGGANGSAGETLDLDRERTRLLAQAMALKLERERIESPRTSAASAASANASATAHAAAHSAAQSNHRPTAPVAQRYVLVPAPRSTEAAAPGEPTAQPRKPASLQPDVRSEPLAPRVAEIAPEPTARAAAAAEDDLESIDRLVGEVLRRGGVEARHPGRIAELYAALIAQEVGDDLADRIVEDVQSSLTAEELANDHAVRSAAIERIAALLPRGESLAPGRDGRWRRGERPMTIAFVGPTGVGKTTTVAKIAATLKLRHAARVALITCDTYRIAAVDQLRTYAEIIGVPLEVVLSPGHMHQACRKLADADVVLIDTAGRSQNDSERIGDLQALLAAAEPHETHLVLSSVASERALLREAEAFSSVGVDRVVLTKLDEAAGLGVALRVLRRVGRSVSYLTTGQEVPQHIEAARPQRLAELVLGGVPAS